jgi:hypothetical protein
MYILLLIQFLNIFCLYSLCFKQNDNNDMLLYAYIHMLLYAYIHVYYISVMLL